MTTPTTDPTSKIIIVSGQEFMVPIATDIEAIRKQLVTMGYADVAAAKPEPGTKEIDGVLYQTIEFVKKAGTKGAGIGGAELAELLAQAPPAELNAIAGLSAEQARLVRLLTNGLMAVGQALEHYDTLTQALEQARTTEPRTTESEKLCRAVDRAPAAPCAIPSAW